MFIMKVFMFLFKEKKNLSDNQGHMFYSIA